MEEPERGAIVLFQVGDSWEVYENDATVCRDFLGLPITMRVNPLSSPEFIAMPTARFPLADFDANVAKLSAAGWRVTVSQRFYPEESWERRP